MTPGAIAPHSPDPANPNALTTEPIAPNRRHADLRSPLRPRTSFNATNNLG
jgi:hypothetical protein